MSEVRKKARALLAYVATDGAGDVRALDTLAVLCDENDALQAELAKVAAVLARQSSEVNGLTAEVDCMEHEDTKLRAEVERLRAELAETADERNAAWRDLREILSKCVQGLGDSASTIVESVAANLLRDEVKRLKALKGRP